VALRSSAFDAACRRIASIDQLGNITSSTLDAAGRTIATQNALSYLTSMSYDQRTCYIGGHETLETIFKGKVIGSQLDPNGSLSGSVTGQSLNKCISAACSGSKCTPNHCCSADDHPLFPSQTDTTTTDYPIGFNLIQQDYAGGQDFKKCGKLRNASKTMTIQWSGPGGAPKPWSPS